MPELSSLPLGFGLALALPFALIALSGFVKISLAVSLLRLGFGRPEALPASLATALSVALTLVSLTPLLGELEQRWGERPERSLGERAAALQPLLRAHLRAKSAPADRLRVRAVSDELLRQSAPSTLQGEICAFVLTQLREGLLLGLCFLIPLALVDLFVAYLLALSGLAGLPSQWLAVPLKLALFLSLDGWGRLLEVLALRPLVDAAL